MTDTPETSNWALNAQVFLGRIHAIDPSGRRRALYPSLFTDAEGASIGGQSDWLVAGNEHPACVMRFLLHSTTPNRLNFMIMGNAEHQDKKLGVSRNGYLGFYRYASVVDYFKLEPLQWGQDSLLCRWRDHLGHQVKARSEAPEASARFSYMNVQMGNPLTFLVERIAQ
ncbi:TPA: hypothetical protein SMR47_002087 [Pseudomonas putida]|uniref:hypothetical protein n=1 Tax=Pseudomonas TaxID=286 RepID=UPI000AF61980|nr:MULTISPECIES: hypothetical protein [Pseudomonas]HEK0906164.1 hypothetical protein [Pseudomonas putida]HEK1768158.1 hypothetical protein [Pseudomonas putida]